MANSSLQLSIIFPLLDAQTDVPDLFKTTARQINIDKSAIEIIVVNDGSSDNTVGCIEDYKSMFHEYDKFIIINHAQREGLAKTRRDGALKARGKFITFLDKKSRPDEDYIANLLDKKRNIVIGNSYADKSRGEWVRVLTLIRKKMYFPYYNHPFDDIDLDFETYRRFKNKGGGGVMLVLRSYYLEVTRDQKMGKDVNDDSMLIESLAKIEPILKTASARSEYIGRMGFRQNVSHIYGRGPKFIDYYTKPGTRFFPFVVAFAVLLILNVALVILSPSLLLVELVAIIFFLLAISLYISEGAHDFLACLIILPIAMLSFCAGVIKGLVMKLTRAY